MRQVSQPVYHEIDVVAASPKFGNCGSPGWGFTAWSDSIDDEAPHRALLERIIADHSDMTLTLPAWERHEDFVEGEIFWEGRSAWVYYETLLSYLSFWSNEQDDVVFLRARVLASASKAGMFWQP